MLSPADLEVVARDASLPGLATVLDAFASADLVRRQLTDAPPGIPVISYVRYKPGASCLTALRYPAPLGDAFVTLKAVGLDATEKWAKYANHRGALRDDAGRIVLRRFPLDGALSGPRWLCDPSRREDACRDLCLPRSVFEVLAYKPERRLVMAASEGARPLAVVKCYDETGFTHALRAHQALANVEGLMVRSATAWSERRRTIATPWIDGRLLSVAHDPVYLFGIAGERLADIHNAPLQLRDTESEQVAQVGLHRIVQAVAHWAPSSRDAMQRIVFRLATLRHESRIDAVPIHGDFYTKQILLAPDGVWLLDFDECAMADPHTDLALFVAHLERDVLRDTCTRERADTVTSALLEGYGRSRAIDARRLTWRTAEAMLRLSPHPFRHRDPDWPALTRHLIARAETLLDTLPPHRSSSTRLAPSVSAPPTGVWAALSNDSALNFATALRDPEVATRLLTGRQGTTVTPPVTVQHTSLLRHKPGRRGLIAFDVRTDTATERWLGKVRARGTDLRAAAIHERLWSAGARCIPEPLGVVPAAHMTLQRAVPGIPLLQALTQGGSPSALGTAVADTLHAFHSLPVDPDRHWSLEDELSVLGERAAALRARLPGRSLQLARIYDALMDVGLSFRTRSTRTLIHRDFYHDQVLIDGDTCTIVDLDLVSTGDPGIDLGNFAAHLIELHWRDRLDTATAAACLTAFADASIARAPQRVTHDVIARYTLLSLGRLLEIASRFPDRAPYVPRLVERLDEGIARFGQHAWPAPTTEVHAWYAA